LTAAGGTAILACHCLLDGPGGTRRRCTIQGRWRMKSHPAEVTRPSIALLVLSLLTTAAAPAQGGGHDRRPPPQPPPKPPYPEMTAIRVYPCRWSWIHWWEANRDEFLNIVSRSRETHQPDSKVVESCRGKAVEALLEATRSTRWRTRASAALSLGRIGEAQAGPVLQKMAGADKSETVRATALAAIGLLDGREYEEFLAAVRYPTPLTREAGLFGLGLLTRNQPKTLTSLQQLILDSDPALATLAAWGVKFRSDQANRQFLSRVIDRSKSPWLVSEAILSLGHQRRSDAVVPLAGILQATARARRLPSWKLLEEAKASTITKVKNDPKNPEYKKRLEAMEEWRRQAPGGVNVLAPPRRGKIPTMIGVSEVYMSRIRASAAIALGRIGDPMSRQALLQAIRARDDKYSELYKGFVIMSLAGLADRTCVPVFLKMLDPRTKTTIVRRDRKAYRNSPLRGYAALALGLHAGRLKRPQGVVNRPLHDKVAARLAKYMADPAETLEVRAACAMGLGLTGRTANLKLLRAAGKTIRANDDILIGYTLLARGMLGDVNILAPARKYLRQRGRNTDRASLLGARAAVLGLGLLGSQQVIPDLVDAWGLGYYVNREVCVAFRLCRPHNVTDLLVKWLKESDTELAESFAARCLGDIFLKRRPQRLARLISQSNYTMKNVKMTRFQALANEFLFIYLIPCFGDQWR